MVYLTTPNCNAHLLTELLLPSILTFPVAWDPIYGSRAVREQHRTLLIQELAEATKRVKKILTHLTKELTERSNKTPLLLPVRNFDIPAVQNMLSEIQRILLAAVDPTVAIRQRVAKFEQIYPPQLDQSRRPPQTVFTNPQKIRFRAPGKDRHGSAHPETEGHRDSCVVSAFKRLGAAYHPCFHYDCSRLNQAVLSAQVYGCHSEKNWTRGHPHLNIAPNDAVR